MTDEKLMLAYADGDSAAFDTLFERYAPTLLRTMDAAAVRQTFLQMHRARHDFVPGSRLRPWLMHIAANWNRRVASESGTASPLS